jgi:hypothetical protein
MRLKVICVAIFFLVDVVSSAAQSASATRAICLEQVGKIDRSVFPLAISDSKDGAKWCLDELGVPKEVLSAQVAAPATMTDFLVEMGTVTGTTKKVLAPRLGSAGCSDHGQAPPGPRSEDANYG